MRPRARVAFLLGAVSLIVLTQGSLSSSSWLRSSQNLHIHESLHSGEIQRLINEQIDLFRVELIQGLSTPLSHRRQKRAAVKTSEVMGMDAIPSVNIQFMSNLVNPDMSCFPYNGTRYCIVGDTLYSVSDGHFEHILSGFPVQEGYQIRTYVYQNVIFFAFFNKKTATLRLRQLQGPNATELKFIQDMSADKLEDCLFFEHSDNLYMALAVQMGPEQYAQNIGMQCIIYEWLGTTMDMIHTIPVGNLERIVFFPTSSEDAHLLFIQSGYKAQLWLLTEETDETLLTYMIDMVDIGLTELNQVHNLTVADQDCMLFGGKDQSAIFCLISEKLLRWQTLNHNHTTNPYAWSAVHQFNVSGSYISSLLIFHINNPELQSNRYDFYYSNSSGLFALGFSEEKDSEEGCVPEISLAFLDSSAVTAQLIQTCNLNESSTLQGYTLKFSEASMDDPPLDPLVQCLFEINSLIEQLSEIDDASDVERNFLTVDDDFVTNGTVFVKELNYIPPDLGSIEVIFDPTEEFNTTAEISKLTETLMESAKELQNELPKFIYSTSDSNVIAGNVVFNGNLEASKADLPDVLARNVNGFVWDEFLPDVLRYSTDQEIDHDLSIDRIITGDLNTSSTIGGRDPAKWLLKEGGTLTGKVTFQKVEVGEDVDVKDNTVNGVDMKKALTKNETEFVVSGDKRFRQLYVKNETTAPLINDKNFNTWAENVARSNIGDIPKFNGSVEMEGPIDVRFLECDFVNNFHLKNISHLFVMKSSEEDQEVTGHVHFMKDVHIVDARITTLNGVTIDDLLTTSTMQNVLTGLNVTEIVVDGDVSCSEIQNLDFQNVVFSHDPEKVISGPVVFQNDVNILELNVEPGAQLNDLDLDDLLNPDMITIDPDVAVENAFIESLSAPSVNDFDVTDLDQRYWTKSTDQDVAVDLGIASTTRITGSVTSATFLGRPLQEFLQTKSDEQVDADVTFVGHVDVAGQLTVPPGEDGIEIHGVNLRSLDNNVVKKVGQFQVNGTKIVQAVKIIGNLTVNETINDLKIPDDIALLDRPQTLSNAVFEKDVIIDDNVTASNGPVTANKINDVHIDDFIKNALFVDGAAHIASLHLENDTTVGSINVQNLNGVNIDDINRFGLRKSGSDQQNLTDLIVNGNLDLEGPVVVYSLNGFNVTGMLSQIVDGRQLQPITGNKTIANLHVDSDALFKKFNDRPLDFSNILSASRDQNITGLFSFDNFTVDSIEMRSVNGMNLSDLVKTSGTDEIQVITGEMEVDNMTIVGQLSIESRVLNNCSVPKLHDIDTFTEFDSITIVNGSLVLKTPPENNRKLADITRNSVRTDQPQEIKGLVEIDVSGQNVSMRKMKLENGRIGSIDVGELFNKALLKSADQKIEIPVRYTNKITVDNLERADNFEFEKWKGESVQKMLDEIVPKSGPQTINAKKIIHGTWSVNNINVSGKIDGVAVDQLVKTSDKSFPPETTFSSLTINQLDSGGFIDGVNVTELVRERVPVSASSVVNSSIVFAADISAGDVLVDQVNDLPMNELVLRIAEPNQLISGKKVVKGNVDFQGDLIVQQLNDRIPEDAVVNLVEKDKNAEFEKPVTFAGNLQVMENVIINKYDSSPLSDQLKNVVSSDLSPLNETDDDILKDNILAVLQRTPSNSFASFEYFESVQELPLDLPVATNSILKIGTSPISSSMSVVYTIRNSNGETCEEDESCRCYRTTVMSLDEEGCPKTLRYPPRFRDFIDSKQSGKNGAKIFVFHRDDWVFIIGSSMQKSSGECSKDTVFIAALDSNSYESKIETTVELDSFLSDAVLEQHPNGTIFIAISQSSSNVLIYTFDGSSIDLHQSIEMEGAIALDMTVVNSADRGTLLLAIAVPGLETNSTLWMHDQGKFELIQLLNTIGPMDVLFTTTEDSIYVTFAQDPANVEQFGESWSQYNVPARVFRYTEATSRFEMFQKLDVDRVISLTNLNILGVPYVATASRVTGVRIHRVVPGQGFQTEQTFQLPDVQSIVGYSVGDQTYLSAVHRNKIQTFVARIRGLKKPTV